VLNLSDITSKDTIM